MSENSISYEFRGSAPRTMFDILSDEDDKEVGPENPFNAEYDKYIQPMRFAASAPRFH